ncbi:MAG: glycosyl hydrolase, partial [Clostridia bacterium]|nr:glycosyl hydrolase [Clostridia bacterium]
MADKNEENLISMLNVEDKIALQTGNGCWNTCLIDKLSIPSVAFADGPLGLRKMDGEATVPTVAFPSMAKMACSFDTDALRSYGVALGEQCRANNVDVLLGPAVNIKRDPRCGRNFEYFSEDPLLTANLASAYIDGVTSQGVGVCVKHFAANNQEYGRLVCDSVIDDRALREIYLSAFERIIKRTKPCAVMCSYNKLNGEYCSQNKWLLTDVLRTEWGYKGIVI